MDSEKIMLNISPSPNIGPMCTDGAVWDRDPKFSPHEWVTDTLESVKND